MRGCRAFRLMPINQSKHVSIGDNAYRIPEPTPVVPQSAAAGSLSAVFLGAQRY
jgi:hypothetical protein